MWNAPMFAPMNLTCCWPAPTTCLHSRKVISRLNRSATIPRMSATLAEVSVQKYALHPVGSAPRATPDRPPSRSPGRQERLVLLDHLLPIQVERVGRPASPLAAPPGQVDLV